MAKRIPNATCSECREPFYKRPSNKATIAFCSRDCQKAYHRRKACANCNTVYYSSDGRSKFCSVACMNTALKTKPPKVCQQCGSEYRSHKAKSKFCSHGCYGLSIAEDAHPMWRGGTAKISSRGVGWQKVKDRIRERDDNTCQRCGKTAEQQGRNMDVHHIVSFFDFADPVEANRDGNLICLCRSCHRRVENDARGVA